MTRTCALFGAGDYAGMSRPVIKAGVLVIAVDAGWEQVKRWGLQPNLAVGDFDSLGYVPDGVPRVQFPAVKDEPDMLLAVREGIKRNCSCFLIYGGLGGRLDHTLGNLQVLAWLCERDRTGFLLGRDTAIAAIQNGALTFSPEHRGYLSLFPWGGEATVTLTGLKFPLTHGVLSCDYPLGVSNEFLGQRATVQVEQGMALALWNQPELLPCPPCP